MRSLELKCEIALDVSLIVPCNIHRFYRFDYIILPVVR